MRVNPENAEDLTGVWHGRYFYARVLPPVSFMATLIESGASVTGAVSEPAPSNDGTTAHASLSGQRSGSAVTFVKTYDNLKPTPLPIDYAGSLSADATEIEGTWRIRGLAAGSFLMIRSPRKAASAARKETERA